MLSDSLEITSSIIHLKSSQLEIYIVKMFMLQCLKVKYIPAIDEPMEKTVIQSMNLVLEYLFVNDLTFEHQSE